MQFRIGVNLGDVMIRATTCWATRQRRSAARGIAEPGGIYVASSVYDQIAGLT
jgi:class 3 adenylate cyclase